MIRFQHATELRDEGWYGHIKLTSLDDDPGEPATMEKGPFKTEEEVLEQIRSLKDGMIAQGMSIE